MFWSALQYNICQRFQVQITSLFVALLFEDLKQMDKAAERARQGDLSYFESLGTAELERLSTRKDEDGRSLLHTAASSGSLELVELIAGHGGRALVNDKDDEVSHGLARPACIPMQCYMQNHAWASH